MNISVKTIKHSKQRYDSVGDWFFTKKGDLEVRVSKLGDWRMEYLVASHEIREALLCKYRGITQKQVDDFDIQYEKDRKKGKYNPDEEPGDDPHAPYRKEHQYATAIEMIDAGQFEVDWDEYDAKVMSL